MSFDDARRSRRCTPRVAIIAALGSRVREPARVRPRARRGTSCRAVPAPSARRGRDACRSTPARACSCRGVSPAGSTAALAPGTVVVPRARARARRRARSTSTPRGTRVWPRSRTSFAVEVGDLLDACRRALESPEAKRRGAPRLAPSPSTWSRRQSRASRASARAVRRAARRRRRRRRCAAGRCRAVDRRARPTAHGGGAARRREPGGSGGRSSRLAARYRVASRVLDRLAHALARRRVLVGDEPARPAES